MYSKTASFFRYAFFAAFMLLLNSRTFASHIVGADLYYTHVSGNTYTVTFVAYGDCGPMSAAAFSTLPTSSPQICIYNGDTLINSISLTIVAPIAGVEVTPLCPGDTSQCTSPTSTIPGVKKFVYSGNVTLPYTSSVWRFTYSGYNGTGSAAGRAAAITNLSSAGATVMQLVDTLNNASSANSSTHLTVAQQTFFCLNNPNNYNPGAVDPDGDDISITLTGAMSGAATTSCTATSTAVSYTGTAWPGTAISAVTPIVCDSAMFSVAPATGDMLFTPNMVQRGVVVYNIEERRSGVLVGTSQREMTVLVLTCSAGSFPCISSTTAAPEIINNEAAAEIYPNPANDELAIKAGSGVYQSFTIINNVGQLMIQQQITGPQTSVNIQTLPAGMYYITLYGKSGTQVRKFVKW